jgi:hypothetical protein
MEGRKPGAKEKCEAFVNKKPQVGFLVLWLMKLLCDPGAAHLTSLGFIFLT